MWIVPRRDGLAYLGAGTYLVAVAPEPVSSARSPASSSRSGAPGSWATRLAQAGNQAVVGARPGLIALARFGLVVKGLVQLLVGVLAVAVVFGDRHGRVTDAHGALLALAAQPFGRPLMFLLTAGLFAYAGFRFVQGLFDPQGRGRGPGALFFRIADVVGGIGYVLLGIGAGRLFLGLGGISSDARSRRLAAEALALPYGPKMLFAFALVVFALALLFLVRAFIVRDVCGDLLTDRMRPATCHATAFLIRFASLVQAILFGTMATLFYRAAQLHSAGEVRGMGGVARLIGARQGTIVLAAIALGFVAMALTSFVEARWRKEFFPSPHPRPPS
jgi:Domain of Unknown Function (DUF1206)